METIENRQILYAQHISNRVVGSELLNKSMYTENILWPRCRTCQYTVYRTWLGPMSLKRQYIYVSNLHSDWGIEHALGLRYCTFDTKLQPGSSEVWISTNRVYRRTNAQVQGQVIPTNTELQVVWLNKAHATMQHKLEENRNRPHFPSTPKIATAPQV